MDGVPGTPSAPRAPSAGLRGDGQGVSCQRYRAPRGYSDQVLEGLVDCIDVLKFVVQMQFEGAAHQTHPRDASKLGAALRSLQNTRVAADDFSREASRR